MTNKNTKVALREDELCECKENCIFIKQMEEDTQKYFNALVTMNLCLNIMEHYVDSFPIIINNIIYEIQDHVDNFVDKLFPENHGSETPISLNTKKHLSEKERPSSDSDKPVKASKTKEKSKKDYLSMICNGLINELKKNRSVLV